MQKTIRLTDFLHELRLVQASRGGGRRLSLRIQSKYTKMLYSHTHSAPLHLALALRRGHPKKGLGVGGDEEAGNNKLFQLPAHTPPCTARVKGQERAERRG